MDSSAIRYGIPARSKVISVAVSTPSSAHPKYCRLRLDVSGKSTINNGWTYAINAFSLNEGDVFMFTFKDDRNLPTTRRDQFAWLRLVMVKLEPEA